MLTPDQLINAVNPGCQFPGRGVERPDQPGIVELAGLRLTVGQVFGHRRVMGDLGNHGRPERFADLTRRIRLTSTDHDQTKAALMRLQPRMLPERQQVNPS